AVEPAKQKLIESESSANLRAEIEAKKAAIRVANQTKPVDALQVANAPAVLVAHDDFSSPKLDLAQQFTGKGSYSNGRLKQSQADGGRAVLRMQQMPPKDFEARLEYIPGNGGVYKSIGIAFDMTETGSELRGYVSALEGQSKSQITTKPVGAANIYPA